VGCAKCSAAWARCPGGKTFWCSPRSRGPERGRQRDGVYSAQCVQSAAWGCVRAAFASNRFAKRSVDEASQGPRGVGDWTRLNWLRSAAGVLGSRRRIFLCGTSGVVRRGACQRQQAGTAPRPKVRSTPRQGPGRDENSGPSRCPATEQPSTQQRGGGRRLEFPPTGAVPGQRRLRDPRWARPWKAASTPSGLHFAAASQRRCRQRNSDRSHTSADDGWS